MDKAIKILALGMISLLQPVIACGEEGKKSGKRGATIEVFAKYQYTGFGGESLLEMTGSGIDAGLRMFADSSARFGLGFQFGWFGHQTQFSQARRTNGADAGSLDGAGWTLTGDIYHRLLSEEFEPYVFYGLGCIYKKHVYHFQSVPDFQKKILTPVMDIGAGIRLPVAGRFYIVPEVRLLFSPFKRALDADTDYRTKFVLGNVGIGTTYILSCNCHQSPGLRLRSIRGGSRSQSYRVPGNMLRPVWPQRRRQNDHDEVPAEPSSSARRPACRARIGSCPAGRSRIWWSKMLPLAGAYISVGVTIVAGQYLAVAAWGTSFQSWNGGGLFAPVVLLTGVMCSSAFWTLQSRSVIGGMVLPLAMQALIAGVIAWFASGSAMNITKVRANIARVASPTSTARVPAMQMPAKTLFHHRLKKHRCRRQFLLGYHTKSG